MARKIRRKNEKYRANKQTINSNKSNLKQAASMYEANEIDDAHLKTKYDEEQLENESVDCLNAILKKERKAFVLNMQEHESLKNQYKKLANAKIVMASEYDKQSQITIKCLNRSKIALEEARDTATSHRQEIKILKSKNETLQNKNVDLHAKYVQIRNYSAEIDEKYKIMKMKHDRLQRKCNQIKKANDEMARNYRSTLERANGMEVEHRRLEKKNKEKEQALIKSQKEWNELNRRLTTAQREADWRRT